MVIVFSTTVRLYSRSHDSTFQTRPPRAWIRQKSSQLFCLHGATSSTYIDQIFAQVLKWMVKHVQFVSICGVFGSSETGLFMVSGVTDSSWAGHPFLLAMRSEKGLTEWIEPPTNDSWGYSPSTLGFILLSKWAIKLAINMFCATSLRISMVLESWLTFTFNWSQSFVQVWPCISYNWS